MEHGRVDSTYGWAVAVGAAVAQFVALGSINCFGVFFEELQKSFNVGSAHLAAVVSLANFVAPLVGTIAGAVADRYGVQGLIILAAVCQGTSYFGASATTSYVPLLLCYGLLAGIAAGCTISPSIRLVGQWFEEKRSTAMGVAFAGAGLGQVLLPPIATALVGTYGWKITFRCLSALSIAVLMASVVMRRRVILARTALETLKTSSILRSKGFVPLLFIGFFFSYGFFIPIVHIAFYARGLGIDAMRAGYLLSILGLLTTVGNVTWGGLADKYSNLQVFRVCHFTSGVALCLLSYCTSYLTIMALVAIMGFFNGGCITCYPAIIAEHFPPNQLGGAISLVYTGFGIGSLVGPTFTGWLLDVTGTYKYATVLGGTAFFFALWAAYFLPDPGTAYLLESIRHCEYGTLEGSFTSSTAREEGPRSLSRRHGSI